MSQFALAEIMPNGEIRIITGLATNAHEVAMRQPRTEYETVTSCFGTVLHVEQRSDD